MRVAQRIQPSCGLTKKLQTICSVCIIYNMFMKKRRNLTIAMKARRPAASTVIAIVCMTAAFLAVAYYIIFPSRGLFTSDCSDTIMWAQASFDAKAIFNGNFHYAAFLPFSGYLLMLPFIGIFGVSMTANIIGMFLFFVLFILSIVILLKTLKWDMKWSAVMISLMLLIFSSSDKLREIFWGHVIYYSLGILFLFIGVALVLKTINISNNETNTGNKKSYFYLTLVFIWFLLCSTNGIQALAIFTIPAIAAVAGELFFNFKVRLKDKRNFNTYKIIIVMLAGTIAGYIAGIVLIGDMKAPYSTMYSVYSDPGAWIGNLSNFLPHWATLLGVNVSYDDAIFSINGFGNFIRIAVSFILIIVPALMVFMYGKIKDVPTRILIITHWVMTALIMFGYVFGKLSETNWRLSPIVCTSTLLCVIFCKWIYENSSVKRVLAIILLPLIIVSAVSAVNIVAMAPDYKQGEGLYPIKNFLIENNLTYGYATYWNANAMTVISDSKVRIRSVDISGKNCVPNYYQSQDYWYYKQNGQDKYFVLVTMTEYMSMLNNKNIIFANSDKTFIYKNYVIIVFNEYFL